MAATKAELERWAEVVRNAGATVSGRRGRLLAQVAEEMDAELEGRKTKAEPAKKDEEKAPEA